MIAGTDVRPRAYPGGDLSECWYKILYGKRDCKCARGKKCAYGTGRIVGGQLRWDSMTEFQCNSYHLRCLSDTSAKNFLKRARMEEDFRDASEEEIVEGFLSGFRDELKEDFHREGVKRVLLKLFKREPIDEEDAEFFYRVDKTKVVALEPEKKTKKETKTQKAKKTKALPSSSKRKETKTATTKKTKEASKAKGGVEKKPKATAKKKPKATTKKKPKATAKKKKS